MVGITGKSKKANFLQRQKRERKNERKKERKKERKVIALGKNLTRVVQSLLFVAFN